MLDKIDVASINSWFNVDGAPTYNDVYYNTGLIIDRSEQWMSDTLQIVTRTNFYLNSLEKKHSRAVYGFIDLLGDLGGVLEVIMVFTGAIFLPISEHHYTL